MTTAFRVDRRLRSTSLHMAGLSVLAIAGATAVGAAIEALYGDDHVVALSASALGLGAFGSVAWRVSVVPPGMNNIAVALRAVGLSWLAISLAAAVPYLATGVLRFDDAVFEAISGLTGTGSTVLSPIEGNGRGLLFYRQMTQWVGGMGVVVLAVAVLPFLGIGGLSLLRAESPGPTSDQLAARVSDTARRLWGIYGALTLIATLVLLGCGMNLYDAVAHAMTGVGTGGFSPYNDSILHFDSALAEFGLIVTMFLGSTKFPLFYAAYRLRDPRVFWRSSEFRFFVALQWGAVAAVTLLNWRDGMDATAALRSAAFNVVSLMSTTGFGTEDYTTWVAASQLILLFVMVTGSMAGSTSAAVKIFRVQVVLKHAWREIRRVRQPRGVFPIRLGREPVPEEVVRSILGYVMVYFVICVAAIVALGLLGSNLPTAAGSVITAMGGVGPGLDATGPASNFLVLDALSLLVLDVCMLLGRLEIFPVFALIPLPGIVGWMRRRSVRLRRRDDPASVLVGRQVEDEFGQDPTGVQGLDPVQ